MSDRVLIIGISWYLIKDFGDSTLALFLPLVMLPYLIAVFFSGSLIRRLTAISVIKYAEFIRAIIYIILGAIYFLVPISSIKVLTIMVLLANTASAIFNPALLMAPKEIFLNDKALQSCLGCLNSCDSASRLLGPILAIPIYALFTIKGLLLTCGIAYMFAWFGELFIRPDARRGKAVANENYLWLKHPFMLLNKYKLISLLLIIFFLTNLFVTPIQIFLPVMAKSTFHGGLKLFSYFEILLALGMLSGGFYITTRAFFTKPWQKISIPYAIFSIAYIGLSQSNNVSFAAFGLFLMGFFLAIGNVTTLTFFQNYSDASDTSDIMAYVSFISTASTPIAMSLVGWLLKSLSVYQLITFYAVGALLVTSLIIFNKQYRSLQT